MAQLVPVLDRFYFFLDEVCLFYIVQNYLKPIVNMARLKPGLEIKNPM